MCPVRALPLDDGLQVDESEVFAACLPDPNKLSELNKAAGRVRKGGKNPAATWLSSVVANRDWLSFVSGITRSLSHSKPNAKVEQLTSFQPETEAAFVEIASFVMLEGGDFSAVKPETTAGRFLAAVKQKLVEKGPEGVFKRLGQARR